MADSTPMNRSVAVFALLVPTLLGGCASTGSSQGYTPAYQQGLKNYAGTRDVPRAAIDRFTALYSPLNAAYVKKHIDQVYAKKLYFNDTLATLHDRADLEKHLIDTTQRLDYMNLDVKQVWRDGDDVFVRWLMKARFTILGSQRESDTIGITQLRFNRRGQVVFHQDFWDSSQGLDQHVPVVGAFARWLRSQP